MVKGTAASTMLKRLDQERALKGTTSLATLFQKVAVHSPRQRCARISTKGRYGARNFVAPHSLENLDSGISCLLIVLWFLLCLQAPAKPDTVDDLDAAAHPLKDVASPTKSVEPAALNSPAKDTTGHNMSNAATGASSPDQVRTACHQRQMCGHYLLHTHSR